MIGKQIIGTSFRSVLNYNEGKVKKGVAEIIGGNMLGTDSRSLAKEFGMIRALKPNVSRAVYHASLSISPDENLSNEQFRELGEKYLEQMGFGNCQFVIYHHTDTEHLHIHLVANRISMDGNVVSDKWNYKESERIIRELEKEYGLKEVNASEKAKEKTYSTGQFQQSKKTNQAPVRIQLQILVNEALKNSTSIKEFESEINKAGANVMFHTNSNGNVFGLSFELDGIKFKASQLGKAYSWNKIKKQIDYESNKGFSEEKYCRENSAAGSTGQQNTSDKSKGHSGIEESAVTDNWKHKDSVGKSRNAIGQYGSNSSSTQDDARQGGEAIAPNDLHDREDEGKTDWYEMEDLSDGNSDWSINRFKLFSGNSNLSEDDVEEDEFIKRKKRKRKIRR